MRIEQAALIPGGPFPVIVLSLEVTLFRGLQNGNKLYLGRVQKLSAMV
jgi:hypothetical protein